MGIIAILERFFVSGAIFVFLFLSLRFDSFAAGKCRQGIVYYFNEFNPSSWKVENELNYEEVYKNFEFFEVVFNKACDEITVKRYVRGEISSTEKYKLNADGSLSEINSK